MTLSRTTADLLCPPDVVTAIEWRVDELDVDYGLGVEAALPFLTASAHGTGLGRTPSCSPAPAVR
jgi:hypothetical protein